MKVRRIAVLYPITIPWLARCLDGARRYARDQEGWRLILACQPVLDESSRLAATLSRLEDWNRDAMLVASNTEAALRSARTLGIPTVNLACGLFNACGIPRVKVDNEAAGRLAADHLLARGLQQLAYFGCSDVAYSVQRHQGFSQYAKEAGVPCAALLQPYGDESNRNWSQRIQDLTAWLVTLPRPCGVFAAHDHRARFLMEACEEAGLRIPEDIAVIGMDNDKTVCDHSVPTISSVSGNSEQVGWEAMALLDRMMQGDPWPTEDLLIEPDRVVKRQSTNRRYCSDPLVQRAVDFVAENIHLQLNIATIAQHLGVSKRTLELRFRQGVEASPHDYITRMRVQHAQSLLRKPDKRTVDQLARECGFGTAATVYAAFKRIAGESPAGFRKRHAGLDPDEA